MNRRNRSPLGAGGWGNLAEVLRRPVLFLLCLPLTILSAEMRRPDIVVFLTDDQGRLDCAPYGAKDIRTPNMQRLADAGLVFDRAFVASPSLRPQSRRAAHRVDAGPEWC